MICFASDTFSSISGYEALDRQRFRIQKFENFDVTIGAVDASIVSEISARYVVGEN